MRTLPRMGVRGEGWVVLQFLLAAAVVASSLTGVDWPEAARGVLEPIGFVLAATGAVLFLVGVAALGRSFTPLPRPRTPAVLCERGVYRHVRHPIYGGVIAVVVGWSVAVAPLALPASAALALVLWLKSHAEERWLVERYPEYERYRRSTRGRLFPRPF